MNTEDRHWTKDDEMLERFVLNRLNAVERVEAEQHLRTCEICRQAVRTEQELAAGIRRLGRDQLKEKMSLQIERLDERKVPWPKIVSVAAMIGILLCVGVYNRWFVSKENVQPTFMTKSIPNKADSLSSQDHRLDKNEPAQPGTRLKDEGAVSSARVQNEQPRAKELQRDATTRLESNGKKTQTLEPAPPSPQGNAAVSEKQKAMQAGEMVNGDQMNATQPLENSIWIEGTQLSSISETEHNAITYGFEKRKEADKNSLNRAEKLQGGVKLRQREIVLKQQPASLLPPSRQQAQKTSGHEPIQTLLEQTANGLQLTLYLPTGVAEESLQNANIQQIGDDSLVVNLPEQQIGYKLPPGWNLEKQGRGEHK